MRFATQCSGRALSEAPNSRIATATIVPSRQCPTIRGAARRCNGSICPTGTTSPVPEREWAILDRVPLNQVGLFSGEGGTGKSIIEMMKNVAHVAGKDWLGSLPEHGPAILSRRRGRRKTKFTSASPPSPRTTASRFKELIAGGLHVLCLLGQDATLCAVGKSGRSRRPALYRQLYEAAGDLKPKNITIDTLSRAFAGNEIDRVQVYAFAMHMQALAMVAGGSVTVLSHPSLAGIASGSGISGSTAWHGAFRFRQYLKGVKADDGEQPDDDLRELEFKKNQYGPTGETIVLRYQHGLFLPERALSPLDKLAREQKAEEIFLKLLDKFSKRNEQISSKIGAHMFAPTVFAKEPEAKAAGLKKKDFEAAMGRLVERRQDPPRTVRRTLPGYLQARHRWAAEMIVAPPVAPPVALSLPRVCVSPHTPVRDTHGVAHPLGLARVRLSEEGTDLCRLSLVTMWIETEGEPGNRKGRRCTMIRQPTWALHLSNRELVDALGAALQQDWRNNPGLPHRLDVIGDEISRRERAGQWTEADWMEDTATARGGTVLDLPPLPDRRGLNWLHRRAADRSRNPIARRHRIARLSHMGRDTTEDAEADRRAAAAIIALRECIGRRSRESNRDGGGSRERGEGLHHGTSVRIYECGHMSSPSMQPVGSWRSCAAVQVGVAAL